MKPQKRHLTFTTRVALAICLLLGPALAWSEPGARAEETIQHLIHHVAGSDMTFVRNDSEYTPDEAASHMLKKYRHFRDDIQTADDFIELCATRSLMSGEPYRVIDPQGNERNTSDWLRAELAAMQARGQ
jgi:hypothetical protein